MDEETQLRVKVAELAGWKLQCDGPPNYEIIGLHPALHQPDDDLIAIPDMTLDLMHELEEKMTFEQAHNYAVIISEKVMEQARAYIATMEQTNK